MEAEAGRVESIKLLEAELQLATEMRQKEEARSAGARRERDSRAAKLSAATTAAKGLLTKLTRERDNSQREVQQKGQAEAKADLDLRKLEGEAFQSKQRVASLLLQQKQQPEQQPARPTPELCEELSGAVEASSQRRCSEIQGESAQIWELIEEYQLKLSRVLHRKSPGGSGGRDLSDATQEHPSPEVVSEMQEQLNHDFDAIMAQLNQPQLI